MKLRTGMKTDENPYLRELEIDDQNRNADSSIKWNAGENSSEMH